MLAVRTSNGLYLTRDIPHDRGTIQAIGIKDGKAVFAGEVSTAGDPAAAGLTVDWAVILAGRDGIAHVTARMLDDKGRMAPFASNEMASAVEATHRQSFNGMWLAILQSTGKPA